MKHKFTILILSAATIIAMLACGIVDLAMNGNFSWSLIPISSLIFAWVTLFPILGFGKQGICGSLIALSVTIVPFLYILDTIIDTNHMIIAIGARVALITVIYLWCIYSASRILIRPLRTASAALLLAIPFCLTINLSIDRIITTQVIDFWDIISCIILLLFAIVFWIIDARKTKHQEAI